MQAGTRLLVTDSPAAAACARRNGVLTTAGDAVHLGHSASLAAGDVDKLMLDWWLLAHAREAGHFHKASNFLETARLLRGHNVSATRSFAAGCARSPAFAKECRGSFAASGAGGRARTRV